VRWSYSPTLPQCLPKHQQTPPLFFVPTFAVAILTYCRHAFSTQFSRPAPIRAVWGLELRQRGRFLAKTNELGLPLLTTPSTSIFSTVRCNRNEAAVQGPSGSTRRTRWQWQAVHGSAGPSLLLAPQHWADGGATLKSCQWPNSQMCLPATSLNHWPCMQWLVGSGQLQINVCTPATTAAAGQASTATPLSGRAGACDKFGS